MSRRLCAIAAGIGLGFSNEGFPSWVTFSLFLAVATGLGAWAGKARSGAAFWHGWALTFVAILISGIITLVALCSAPPTRQPSVLIPWTQFAVAMVYMASVWGAVGGLVAWALGARHRSTN